MLVTKYFFYIYFDNKKKKIEEKLSHDESSIETNEIGIIYYFIWIFIFFVLFLLISVK